MNRFMLLALGTGTAAVAGYGYLANPPVELQATTPGTIQSGHSNITGTARAGFFRGNGSLLTNLNGSAINTGVITLTGASSTYMIRAMNSDGSPNASALIGLATSPTGITYGTWAETQSNEGRALFGYASSTTGATYGSYAVNNSSGGRAAFGLATSPIGTTYGGWFQSNSPIGVGTYARNIAGGTGLRAESNGRALEVLGAATFSGRVGIGTTSPSWPLHIISSELALIRAEGTGTAGQTTTGYFSTASNTGNAIFARATASIGSSAGIRAYSSGPDGYGVLSEASPTGYAFHGTGHTSLTSSGTSRPAFSLRNTGNVDTAILTSSSFSNTAPILTLSNSGTGNALSILMPNQSNVGAGVSINQAGIGPGVSATSQGGNALSGTTAALSAAGAIGRNNSGEAVVGINDSTFPGVGAVVGRNNGEEGIGVRGFATDLNGIGVLGQVGISGGRDGYAVRGEAVNAAGTPIGIYGKATGIAHVAALYGEGKMIATGTKSFLIDDPQDPLNKMLYHYCSESDQPMLTYSGNVTTDGKGDAWVTLPPYVQDIGKDFRYQLTVIGSFAQAIVGSEIEADRFQIRTDKPNVKVSWRVEGVRNDRFVQEYGAPVSVDKPANWKGKYLMPGLYDAKPDRGIHYLTPAPAGLASDRLSTPTSNLGGRPTGGTRVSGKNQPRR